MLNNPLWCFSLAFYREPGVEPILLTLQNRFEADINLLLLCCWLASQQRRLSPVALELLLALSADWQARCVRPLRVLRRHLKARGGAEQFREQVKALELEAERLQQQQLYELSVQQLGEEDSRKASDIAGDNLRLYGEGLRLAEGLGVEEVGELDELLIALADLLNSYAR